MTVKYHLVNEGDVLYDVGWTRSQHSVVKCKAVWEVRILEKRENGCMVSWNGNAPVFRSVKSVCKLHRKKPEK